MTPVRAKHSYPDLRFDPGGVARIERRAGHADINTLLTTFPPRPISPRWPATEQTRDDVVTRIETFQPHADRRKTTALTIILSWLEETPADTWQQRWQASGADQAGNSSWTQLAETWAFDQGYRLRNLRKYMSSVLRQLMCADIIRPSLRWLTQERITIPWLGSDMAKWRDPAGFDALTNSATSSEPRSNGAAATRAESFCRVGTILAAKGGEVRDITVGDCMELTARISEASSQPHSLHYYQMLHRIGIFPPNAPASIREFRTVGKLSCDQLIDRYDIACQPVRDLLVDYLRQRESGMDYSSLTNLAFSLGRLFWKDLEVHHPGINSLQLSPETLSAWKQRAQVVTTSNGTTRQRAGFLHCLTLVRAFYLDLAQWAIEDPARWSPWAVPCPIKLDEASHLKRRQLNKARQDQRTRQRLPVLPALVAAVNHEHRDTADRLAAAHQARPGELFTAGGQTLRRSVTTSATVRVWAEDPDTGHRRDLTFEEHRGFWSWAVVEILRATGLRVEELTELTHHSLVHYTLPSTGELVPLLHIAPSKTDTERLLVITPELADVLAAIIGRIRDHTGAVPLVIAYDQLEHTWQPPQPLLLQRHWRMENRPINRDAVRKLLEHAVTIAGITDNNGEPLMFTPHDLRRIFVTESTLNGLPPHIAQHICGHKNINTTMGYKAVYPEEVINSHRAFIARRRRLRPTDEYRRPTDGEWNEFLDHFEKRKVALGTCGRAFSTPCIHEHSCIRCSLLRPDPHQRTRFVEIRQNLYDRIAEAHHRGWLGEVEGLRISLEAAKEKIAYIDALADPSRTSLGMPEFHTVNTQPPPATTEKGNS